jgi:hypothetical protein
MRRSGGRILLGDNRWRDSHVVADQVLVCWSLYFNWIHSCVCVFTFDCMYPQLRLA